SSPCSSRSGCWARRTPARARRLRRPTRPQQAPDLRRRRSFNLEGDAMSTTDASSPAPAAPPPSSWPLLLKKLAIWALFLAALYLARDFFFMGFMTFLFCYLTLAVVGWGMKRLSPDRERPWLRRLLTVAVFLLVPLALLGAGILIGPRLVAQGERMAGW